MRLQNNKKIGDYYIKPTLLGQGAQSKVYLGENQKGEKVAIKQVKKSQKDNKQYKLALSEANILYGLKSPFVCSIIETIESYNHFYVIQKYYEGQNLEKRLKRKGKFQVNQATFIFTKILNAVEYVNNKGLLHRDLKPSNFIYYKEMAVLLDFGLSCKLQKNDEKILSESIGTPVYMCPDKLNNKKYNSKSDIWSLGVIFYEMLHGCLPFNGLTDEQILKEIMSKQKKLKFSPSIPLSIKQLIETCLVVDEKYRISWKDLFQWKKYKWMWGNVGLQAKGEQSQCCLTVF